jgi:hypothetical protein
MDEQSGQELEEINTSCVALLVLRGRKYWGTLSYVPGLNNRECAKCLILLALQTA